MPRGSEAEEEKREPTGALYGASDAADPEANEAEGPEDRMARALRDRGVRNFWTERLEREAAAPYAEEGVLIAARFVRPVFRSADGREEDAPWPPAAPGFAGRGRFLPVRGEFVRREEWD